MYVCIEHIEFNYVNYKKKQWTVDSFLLTTALVNQSWIVKVTKMITIQSSAPLNDININRSSAIAQTLHWTKVQETKKFDLQDQDVSLRDTKKDSKTHWNSLIAKPRDM